MAAGAPAPAPESEGYIDAFAIGLTGQVYGKREPARARRRLIEDGMTMAAATLLYDCRGANPAADGPGAADGDPDALGRVIAGPVPVPWAKLPTEQVLLELVEPATGERLWYDPRKILADVVARLAADGLRPVVACELEFYLVAPERTPEGAVVPASLRRTGAPPRSKGNFSLAMVEEYADLIDAIDAAARAQDVPAGTAVSEYGPGQFEINLGHCDDPVAAADHAVLLRRIVRGVARARGDDATFMAKPFPDQPGSGMHAHVSLLGADGANLMAGEGSLLPHAVAGLQRTLCEGFGFFLPNFSAYRRLQPGMFVPLDDSWGNNNRSVAFRIPVGPDSARRIEHRVAAADASPHLVLAAVLAGLHAGIANRWSPGAETVARTANGDGAPVPRNLVAALDALAAAPILADYIPRRFLDLYRDNRMGEFEALFAAPSRVEYDFYL